MGEHTTGHKGQACAFESTVVVVACVRANQTEVPVWRGQAREASPPFQGDVADEQTASTVHTSNSVWAAQMGLDGAWEEDTRWVGREGSWA